MENQFLLGQRTRLVFVLFLGSIRVRAFHQENTYCQAYLRVSDGGDTSVSLAELLALDTEKSAPHELEQCADGHILLQYGTNVAMANGKDGATNHIVHLGCACGGFYRAEHPLAR